MNNPIQQNIQSQQQSSPRKPVQSIRKGGITIAKWINKKTDNSGNSFDSISFTINKQYKDNTGAWKESTSFTENDLARLRSLLEVALADGIKLSDPNQV